MPRVKTTTKKSTKSSVKKPKKKVVKPRKIKINSRKTQKEKVKKEEKYIEAVGRRKTAIARVRIWTKGEKGIMINEKPYDLYFSTIDLQKIINAPLELLKLKEKSILVIP